jgi:hypothetical protein
MKFVEIFMPSLLALDLLKLHFNYISKLQQLGPYLVKLGLIWLKLSLHYIKGRFDIWCVSLQVSLSDFVACFYACVNKVNMSPYICSARLE